MNTPPTSQEKGVVLKGIITAWILSIIFVGSGYLAAQKFQFFQDWALYKTVAFAGLCSGLALAAGIGWAARIRHLISNIDGSSPQPNSALDITLRYISNTVEQSVLFVISCAAFGVTFPEISRYLLPVMSLWFLIARSLFWIGYVRSPLKRATGFAATFHPTLVLLFAALIGMVIL